ncbi:MAG: hypothetical protein FWG77_06205 [Treponema sp.]|nr:hypothetical protein [Treponema sp.]
MKKMVMVLLIFAVVGASAFSFDILSFPPPVDPGNILVNVGVGFSTLARSGSMVIPPISAAVEYALDVELPITVGGILSVSHNAWEEPLWSNNETLFALAARANWHWGFDVNWLDFYTGLSIGYIYYNINSTWRGTSSIVRNPHASYGTMYWAGQLGARFYFTDRVGAFLELGFPLSQVGVTIKF